MHISLPIAQMYHVAVDNQIPYYVYGGCRTAAAYRAQHGRRAAAAGAAAPRHWESTAGGESGFIVPDPVDPNIVWGGCYNARHHDGRLPYRPPQHRQGLARVDYGLAAADVKYRFNWTFPIAISPHDHNKVYVGSQYVHQTTDGGESWQIISPDLSTNDPSKLGPSGGLTLRQHRRRVRRARLRHRRVAAVGEGLIWAGTNDGLVHVTRDGGESWTNVTENIPGSPRLGHRQQHRALPARCGHGLHHRRFPPDEQPRPLRLQDRRLRSDLDFAHLGHPEERLQLLPLGARGPGAAGACSIWAPRTPSTSPSMTARTGYRCRTTCRTPRFTTWSSRSTSTIWSSATYGRGFWILDDITPLQQLTDEVLAADVPSLCSPADLPHAPRHRRPRA